MGILQACFSFRGRMSIGPYWAVMAAGFLIIVIAAIGSGAMRGSGLGLLIIPGKWMMLAALAKRWHDCDYSGAMCLLNFIPFVGLISLVIAGFIEGTHGSNRF